MKTFKEWIKLKENIWGNIPAKTRKPSDGWQKTGGAGGYAPQVKMMKKMKDK